MKESRDNWEVVTAYENEGDGPWLIDLSHVPKWDIQDSNMDRFSRGSVMIPAAPGETVITGGTLIARLNATQAAVWQLVGNHNPIPDDNACTDITDAYALLALLGREAFAIMERVSPLDLSKPGMETPFLVQGPVLRVRSLIAVMGERRGTQGILIAFPRGYGQSVAEALLDACSDLGLRPAGEQRFIHWMNEKLA